MRKEKVPKGKKEKVSKKVSGNISSGGAGCGMARKLSVEYLGAIYHLMNRGDRRESIFKDDEDRRRFLGTLGEACGKVSERSISPGYCRVLLNRKATFTNSWD
jgi:hypothetical protein